MSPKECPFMIGDRVRLARGWTVMCVIHIDDKGNVRAKYANKHYNPVTKEDFDDPEYAESCYTRHFTGFVPWDGNPKEGYIQMPKLNYKTPDGSLVSIRGRNKDGAKICEFEDGSVGIFQSSELEEIVPYTILVQGFTYSRERAHVEVDEALDIVVGDILLSNRGEFYSVLELGTKSKRPVNTTFVSKLITEKL